MEIRVRGVMVWRGGDSEAPGIDWQQCGTPRRVVHGILALPSGHEDSVYATESSVKPARAKLYSAATLRYRCLCRKWITMNGLDLPHALSIVTDWMDITKRCSTIMVIQSVDVSRPVTFQNKTIETSIVGSGHMFVFRERERERKEAEAHREVLFIKTCQPGPPLTVTQTSPTTEKWPTAAHRLLHLLHR
ncbi:hypothetical protein J6590_017955 [Homalodisca vitripennis]|nr:hypothetical protein J6590_017955 [Homalodisca vitripennis]